jgi:hypothetical protein
MNLKKQPFEFPDKNTNNFFNGSGRFSVPVDKHNGSIFTLSEKMNSFEKNT